MATWTLGQLYAKYKAVPVANPESMDVNTYDAMRTFWASEFHRERARLDMLDVEWVEENPAELYRIMDCVHAGSLDPANVPPRPTLDDALAWLEDIVVQLQQEPGVMTYNMSYFRGTALAVLEYEDGPDDGSDNGSDEEDDDEVQVVEQQEEEDAVMNN